MKRRREIGPKKIKNRNTLVKYILCAVAVALVGLGLVYLAHKFTSPQQNVAGDTNTTSGKVPLLQLLPGIILVATLLAVLGVLFFGVRAYLSGIKARHSILVGRTRKIKK